MELTAEELFNRIGKMERKPLTPEVKEKLEELDRFIHSLSKEEIHNWLESCDEPYL